MEIQIISFGKLKTPGIRCTADHYLKLLSGWANVKEKEIKPESALPHLNREKIQRLDQAKLQSALKNQKEYFLLDERGKPLSTSQWSNFFEYSKDQGKRSLTFVLGSANGFHPEVRDKARDCFSLGPQTLPHELARVVFIEQLFRAISYLGGHPYHNPD